MPIKSLTAFNQGQPWPPEGEGERLKRYRQNYHLFEGKHERVFKDSSEALRPELRAVQRFVLNFYKRLTVHWADLVFGEAPTLTAGEDEASSKALKRLISSNNLMQTSYEVCLDHSIYGDGLYKLRLEQGQAVIEGQPPDFWFPVVSPENIRHYGAQVLGWTFKAMTGIVAKEREFVRLEIHTRGQIEHRAHLLKNGTLGPDHWQQLYPDTPQLEQTGVDDLLIVQVPSLRTTKSVFGRDDYSDLDSLVLEMEDRLAQMSRILDKHADPGMYGPDSAIRFDHELERWVFKKENYVVMDAKDDPVPGYLTWDGDLNSALAEFNLLFEQLMLIAETSPAGLGLPSRSGEISSGFQFRLAMQPDITKAGRIATAFDAGLSKVLRLAAELERANSGSTPELSISIDWRDGLPTDADTNSQIAERGVREGFISRHSAVQLMHPDWTPEQVMAELDRLSEDMAAQAASMPGFAPPAGLFGGGDDDG